MMKEELNVLSVSFVPENETDKYVSFSVKPNFRSLGQKGKGREAQALKKSMTGLGADVARRIVSDVWEKGETTFDGVTMSREDVEIGFETKEGFAAAGDRVGVVVLDTRIDEKLAELGFVRELQNRLQTMRKDIGLEYQDRVNVVINASDRVVAIVTKYKDDLAREVLATSMTIVAALAKDTETSASNVPRNVQEQSKQFDVDGEAVTISMTRA
jgi:isoleucyl-tRNA synthetase